MRWLMGALSSTAPHPGLSGTRSWFGKPLTVSGVSAAVGPQAPACPEQPALGKLGQLHRVHVARFPRHEVSAEFP